MDDSQPARQCRAKQKRGNRRRRSLHPGNQTCIFTGYDVSLSNPVLTGCRVFVSLAVPSIIPNGPSAHVMFRYSALRLHAQTNYCRRPLRSLSNTVTAFHCVLRGDQHFAWHRESPLERRKPFSTFNRLTLGHYCTLRNLHSVQVSHSIVSLCRR